MSSRCGSNNNMPSEHHNYDAPTMHDRTSDSYIADNNEGSSNTIENDHEWEDNNDFARKISLIQKIRTNPDLRKVIGEDIVRALNPSSMSFSSLQKLYTRANDLIHPQKQERLDLPCMGYLLGQKLDDRIRGIPTAQPLITTNTQSFDEKTTSLYYNTQDDESLTRNNASLEEGTPIEEGISMLGALGYAFGDTLQKEASRRSFALRCTPLKK